MNNTDSLPSPGPWTIRGREVYDRNGQLILEFHGPAGIAAANARALLELAAAAEPEQREAA